MLHKTILITTINKISEKHKLWLAAGWTRFDYTKEMISLTDVHVLCPPKLWDLVG